MAVKQLWSVLKTRRPSALPWRDKPPLRLDYLRADTLAIVAVYHQHGFMDAHATFRVDAMREPRVAQVTFVILEGPRSRIRRVVLEGATAYPPDQLRKKLLARPGRPFNPAFLAVDTLRISRLYQDRGFIPHIVPTIDRDSLDVDVRYEIAEGPLYHFGEVYLSTSGESRVREALIRRELLVKPGEVYRYKKVEESQERLYETGLFSQVQTTPIVDSSFTKVEIDMRVRERKPHWLDAGVGSGTAERFRFTGEWGNRNMAGQGLQGAAASKLAFDGNARFLITRTELSLLEPWLFATRTRGQLTVYYERSDDRADPRWVVAQSREGVTFQVRRELGRYVRLVLSQDDAFVKQKIDLLDRALPQAVRDSLLLDVPPSYTTHRLLLGIERDLRDDLLNPTRGSTQSVSAEFAGGPLHGTSSFTKAQAISAWYTPLPNGWVVAARARAGTINPFGKAPSFSPTAGLDQQVGRVPLEDRFRLGGVNSIRGFSENAIPPSGGLALLQANLELRVPVAGPVGLEFFLDAGNVWTRPSYIKAADFAFTASDRRLAPGDVRYVFGVGGRLNLPFGPLRLDLTWSPRPDENGSWLVHQAQFAIGPSF